ncbi:MAG: GNAT family N-acetyltransferase [Candidatus Sericytochromatia bacterium]|nr:GNAT family N-acetyltransferase [Candidatus Sericytochromatia bacterium]
MKPLSQSVPELTTPRLLLRAFQPTDLADFADLRADPAVMRYIGTGPRTPAQTMEALAGLIVQWAQKGYGVWAVSDRATGRFIGECGFYRATEAGLVELGFSLATTAWGHGLATEAAAACLEWAWSHLDTMAIDAVTHPDNAGSANVLGKLGFVLQRDAEFLGQPVQIWQVRLGGNAETVS